MRHTIRINKEMHEQLKSHLFPGDNKEAIAFALCGRFSTSNLKGLLVHKLLFIPHDVCTRRGDFIEWPTDLIDNLVDEAATKGMGILKIHSHPIGNAVFSKLDDESDRILFPAIYSLMNDSEPHVSCIMYSDGNIKGRIVTANNTFIEVDKISIVGDILRITDSRIHHTFDEADLRNRQTFGEGTTSMLKRLKVVVLGCSGTGSITIEQLARLGVGELIIADPDYIEGKNLNRIINSKAADASQHRFKVDVIKEAVESFGFNTKVTSFCSLIQEDRRLQEATIGADFIFGCVDSIEGRSILNSISTFYLIPYIDMGVKLVTDKNGGIDEISGSIHYIQPGLSSLLSRGVYNLKDLASESLKRTNPEMYQEQLKRGYVVDMDVESPAVLPINMQVSSLAVLEFLARVHPFRYDQNEYFSETHISLSDWEIWHEREGTMDKYLYKYVGRGDVKPFLNLILNEYD